MRFNSARPIKALTPKEQEGLRKLLFPTEQREVFTRKLPIDPVTPVTQGTPPRHPVIPWDNPGAVAAYLQPDAALANGRRQHEASQDRPVEGQEIKALIFTFGQEVGDYLASQINLVFSPVILNSEGKEIRGTVISDTEIGLVSDYDPYNVADLGNFIHEATHIWQRSTGLYREEANGDYQYTLDQLHSLNLNKEEHARAVQNWFVANYAYKRALIGDGPGQVDPSYVWGMALHQVLGFSHDDIRDTRDSAKVWTINVHYERLINQIQDPTLLPPSRHKAGTKLPQSILINEIQNLSRLQPIL